MAQETELLYVVTLVIFYLGVSSDDDGDGIPTERQFSH